jgi:hypothetical protein
MEITKKTPVKIVQVQDIHGKKHTSIMLDLNYYFESKDNSNKKVEEFKKLYDKVVEEIKYIFYGKDNQKKYRNLPSSLYYELATIINQFNQKIENDFFITNYDETLHRDFGLSKDYIYDLRIIAKIFKQNEIIDSVPFSYYRALMRKKNQLDKYDRFTDEKKRLNDMGENNKLPGRENYKKEINQTLEKLKQRSIETKN